jgi:hypothetical protein
VAGDDGIGWLDLGHDHAMRWSSWRPDRKLNPQYADVADEPRYGATVRHLTPTGAECFGAITFPSDAQRRIDPYAATWDVVSLDPPTFTPSLLCNSCGDHGFITDGRWVPA